MCTVRTDAPAVANPALLPGLVDAGLARLFRLRPLNDVELTALITDRFGAAPTPELVRHVRRLTRSRPKMVEIALAALLENDCVRAVDRQAHLVRPDVLPALPPRHDILLRLRAMRPAVWAVAKAARC